MVTLFYCHLSRLYAMMSPLGNMNLALELAGSSWQLHDGGGVCLCVCVCDLDD